MFVDEGDIRFNATIYQELAYSERFGQGNPDFLS